MLSYIYITTQCFVRLLLGHTAIMVIMPRSLTLLQRYVILRVLATNVGVSESVCASKCWMYAICACSLLGKLDKNDSGARLADVSHISCVSCVCPCVQQCVNSRFLRLLTMVCSNVASA